MIRVPDFVAALLVSLPVMAADVGMFVGGPLSQSERDARVSSAKASTIIGSGYDATLDPLVSSKITTSLRNVQADLVLTTRSLHDAKIYSTTSPSVVLVLTNEGLGSGSVINKDGKIITNWHVVKGYSDVGIVFKPKSEGQKPSKADLYRAHVIRIDEVADLALLQVPTLPPNLRPITLGSASEIQVGADVHAIGHPTGESWTYTKGQVSQIRNGYKWQGEDEVHHVADVIQTQTPINPGSSGGPLISDAGNLVGVNSFKAEGEALNFAVSVDEVRRFLALQQNRLATSGSSTPTKAKCEGRVVNEGRSTNNDADVTTFDLNCRGKVDAALIVPDDKSKPIRLEIDTKGNGKVDMVVLDLDRDGKWDVSYYDNVGDGKPHVIGYHPDGKIKASRYEPYVAPG